MNVNTDRENHPSLKTRQKKRWKKNEQSLRTHGQRQAYQHRKRSSQKKRRLKKGTEKTFEEIIALKLSDWITITKSADPRDLRRTQLYKQKDHTVTYHMRLLKTTTERSSYSQREKTS